MLSSHHRKKSRIRSFGYLWVPNSYCLLIRRPCQPNSLPPGFPSIDLKKTGILLSSLRKAQYTTTIQRHLSQLALSTNLKLTGLCSVAPSSILLPCFHRLLCVSKYLSCHIPEKLRQICTVQCARRAIHPSAWWHRRHASAALLPLLPRRHRCAGLWGALLGGLEACTAVRVWVPAHAEEWYLRMERSSHR